MDHLVQASVDGAGGEFDPDTGHYLKLEYAGCETPERAKEITQALYRAAKRMGYSMSAKAARDQDGTYTVTFTAIDKEKARAYVLARYGTDRSKWPYSPIAGDPNYG